MLSRRQRHGMRHSLSRPQPRALLTSQAQILPFRTPICWMHCTGLHARGSSPREVFSIRIQAYGANSPLHSTSRYNTLQRTPPFHTHSRKHTCKLCPNGKTLSISLIALLSSERKNLAGRHLTVTDSLSPWRATETDPDF